MTRSYARHTASDMLYDKLVSLADRFVETYLGKYKRPTSLMKKDMSISLQIYTDKDVLKLLDQAEKYLKVDLMEYISAEVDVDLLTIRDDILSEISKTKYLFTLQ